MWMPAAVNRSLPRHHRRRHRRGRAIRLRAVLAVPYHRVPRRPDRPCLSVSSIYFRRGQAGVQSELRTEFMNGGKAVPNGFDGLRARTNGDLASELERKDLRHPLANESTSFFANNATSVPQSRF